MQFISQLIITSIVCLQFFKSPFANDEQFAAGTILAFFILALIAILLTYTFPQ